MLKFFFRNCKDASSVFFLFFLAYVNLNLLKSDTNTYLMKGPLAGSLYYTADKPGRWKDIIESHIPVISKKDHHIEIITNHEMRGFEHYIIKHIVFDKEFNLISEINFDPSRTLAKSTHSIVGYYEKVYVLSICNLHDSWLNVFTLEEDINAKP